MNGILMFFHCTTRALIRLVIVGGFAVKSSGSPLVAQPSQKCQDDGAEPSLVNDLLGKLTLEDKTFAGLLENIQPQPAQTNPAYLKALGLKPVSVQK